MSYTFCQDRYLQNSYINIDSHQVFPDLDINKITSNVCLSDNPKTELFLNENKHLIDEFYLNTNENDWAVNFLINNTEYIDKEYFCYNKNNIAVKFIINNTKYIKKRFFHIIPMI